MNETIFYCYNKHTGDYGGCGTSEISIGEWRSTTIPNPKYDNNTQTCRFDAINRKWIIRPIIAPEEELEIPMLQQQYLQLTEQLCNLANIPYTGKLSNLEYQTTLELVKDIPQAGIIAASLVYTRTCLRELCGNTWWDQIN